MWWTPEIIYYCAFFSQTIFPAAEFVLLLIIIVVNAPGINELTPVIVFFMMMDVGMIIQFFLLLRPPFYASYDHWNAKRDMFYRLRKRKHEYNNRPSARGAMQRNSLNLEDDIEELNAALRQPKEDETQEQQDECTKYLDAKSVPYVNSQNTRDIRRGLIRIG